MLTPKISTKQFSKSLSGNYAVTLFAGMLFMFVQFTQAATITTAGSGNWTSTSNNAPWPGGTLPQPGDSIIIGSGHTLTVNTTASCKAIFFASNSSATTLTISGSNSLTVTNDITFSIPSGNVQQLLAIGAGAVSCKNLTFTSTGSNSKDNNVTISTGSFTASGNISMPGSTSRNSFVCSGAATVTIGGTWSLSGLLTPSTAKFVYNGSSAQSVLGATYQKLVLSGTGNKSFGGSVTVSDTLTIAAGTTLNNSGSTNLRTDGVFYILGTYNETATGGSVTFNGGVYVETTGTVSCSIGETFVFSAGGLINNGTFSCGTSNFSTFQTVSQAISGSGSTTFSTLTINVATTNNTTITVNTSLAGSNTLTQGSGAVLNIVGTSGITGLAASANTNTVNYTASGAQTVKAVAYNDLTLSGSGAKALGGSLAVGGTLTISGASTLTIGGNTLTLNGDFSGSSTNKLTGSSTSNITIDGSGSLGNLFFDQTTPGTSNNIATLTVNRSGLTATLGNNLDVSTSLTLTNGKLAINGQTLNLKGNITNTISNSLVGSSTSTLSISGSGSMNDLFFDTTVAGTTNQLANLTINRSAQIITLGNALNVSGVVTPTAGTLASAGNLTLLSTASATGRIANGGCTTCSYITGNVTIQRFVPAAARRYRFMGSTVQATTLADWKNEIYVTGAGGAVNGFDATTTNSPSAYAYNETVITGDLNTGWTAAATTADTLTPGKGYRIFVRGDRSNTGRLTGALNDQNAVTMNLVGVPNQGNITAAISFTSSGNAANDGWNLVSNPYASPYDWNAHFDDSSTHSKLEPYIMILSAQSGGYVSFNTNADAGNLTNGIIPAGASFWVKANGANPTLIFKEQYKVANNPVSLFKTNEGENFNIKLYYDSITFDDVTVKYINGTLPTYDSYDIRKLAGTVTLSTYGTDNIHLALSSRPLATTVDTIKLYVSGAAGAYQLRFTNSAAIAVADNVFLFDNYTSTVTDLKITDTYSFNIVSGVAASTGLNRFYIVVGNSSAMPVKLLQFTARKTAGKQIQLNWATAQETNSKSFEVERSEDGKQYSTIATLTAGGNTHTLINYTTTDEQPARANYYRLKQIDLDGTYSYSAVKFVMMDEIAGAKLYPVPAHTTLTIEHSSVLTSVSISDISGRLLSTQNAFTATATVDVSGLEAGVYVIEYTDESGQAYKEKFTKE